MLGIKIKSIVSISSLGFEEREIIENYKTNSHNMELNEFGGKEYWVSKLSVENHTRLNDFLNKYPFLKYTDKSVLMASMVTKEAFIKSGWNKKDYILINAGSSRGATGIWENQHKKYVKENNVSVRSSPTTTLGNISSNVAEVLKLDSINIDHSITCGSGMQALANGISWIKSGMVNKAIVIGTESPLTGFTLAQMEALGIYTLSNPSEEFPCRPFYNENSKLNTMVLGEAAVAVCLELSEEITPGDVIITGIGFGNEQLKSSTSIDSNGIGFQKSMQRALSFSNIPVPDIILAHGPGTVKGDEAEKNAIQYSFQSQIPDVYTTKWKTGHTLGASGLLSLHSAILTLQNKVKFSFPYSSYFDLKKRKYNNALINAMGFGGNAISAFVEIIE